MYPARCEKLVLLGAVPSLHLSRAMDLPQFFASLHKFQLAVPWLPELVIPMGDWGLIRECLLGDAFGLRRRKLSEAEIDHYKDALARRGALNGALNYMRSATCRHNAGT
jgi:epoxide hydrolase 4